MPSWAPDVYPCGPHQTAVRTDAVKGKLSSGFRGWRGAKRGTGKERRVSQEEGIPSLRILKSYKGVCAYVRARVTLVVVVRYFPRWKRPNIFNSQVEMQHTFLRPCPHYSMLVFNVTGATRHATTLIWKKPHTCVCEVTNTLVQVLKSILTINSSES